MTSRLAVCFILLFMLNAASCSTFSSNTRTVVNTVALQLDSATVFCESPQEIHAIAFDDKGLMYAAGKADVFKVTPDKSIKHFLTLENTSPTTTIWSMKFGTDGNLYIAAHDRIVKITPDGTQQVIIWENFPGPCGATDLRFDRHGNLYIVYDTFIAKYDTSFNKSILIDGSKFQTPIQWAVGMEFSSDEQYLYIADCRGSHAYVVPTAAKDYYQSAKIYATRWGQYFTKDNDGNIFLTSLGGYRNLPEFIVFKQNLKNREITCKRKPRQNENNYKKTIVFGEAGYDEHAIYCIIGNTIYSYHLDSRNQ
jgi:sugar lactone lactonase YvrE